MSANTSPDWVCGRRPIPEAAEAVRLPANLRPAAVLTAAGRIRGHGYSRSPMASIGLARSATRVDRPIDSNPSNTAPAMIPK